MIALAEPKTLPEAKLVLFIGGPFDRQYRWTRNLDPIYCPKIEPARCVWPDDSIEARTFRVIEYRCWTFAAERIEFYLYATRDLTPATIMARLMDCYAGA